jgi:hypothetical protein
MKMVENAMEINPSAAELLDPEYMQRVYEAIVDMPANADTFAAGHPPIWRNTERALWRFPSADSGASHVVRHVGTMTASTAAETLVFGVEVNSHPEMPIILLEGKLLELARSRMAVTRLASSTPIKFRESLPHGPHVTARAVQARGAEEVPGGLATPADSGEGWSAELTGVTGALVVEAPNTLGGAWRQEVV